MNIIDRIHLAIDYVEKHICDDIKIEDVAKVIYMSVSSFYDVFSNVFDTTIKDYIRKRRLSLSAYDLIHTDLNILDLALKYQYNTYESFSRAFKKLYGIPPKTYRNNGQYIDIFPRIDLFIVSFSEGEKMIQKEMNKESVIKQLNSVSKGYLLDIDLDHFDSVNKNYGCHIGDKVLVEVPQRIQRILKQYDLDIVVTRIGNDEFVVILKECSEEFVKDLSNSIIESIKHPFIFEEYKFTLTVSIGVSAFTIGNHEEDIIKNAKQAMLTAKNLGKNQYVIYNI